MRCTIKYPILNKYPIIYSILYESNAFKKKHQYLYNSLCIPSFNKAYCIHLFLLFNTKEDILKNVGNQTVVGSH